MKTDRITGSYRAAVCLYLDNAAIYRRQVARTLAAGCDTRPTRWISEARAMLEHARRYQQSAHLGLAR